MVIQLVSVSIRPEQRERWLELIPRNAAQTRAEEGCESYRISEELETPNVVRSERPADERIDARTPVGRDHPLARV
jgi:quinol monooxygenase YgiN